MVLDYRSPISNSDMISYLINSIISFTARFLYMVYASKLKIQPLFHIKFSLSLSFAVRARKPASQPAS